MQDLAGKAAFVTGGASGIGLALGQGLGRPQDCEAGEITMQPPCA
jgi:NAD(P)-dependent dehydrogenase (short-subunit alcohol dehydrogenase family)